MPGRKPKPTALRLIEGNREHRTIHAELEPQPAKVAPACPKELKGDARAAWRYLVRELAAMQCLASSDRGQMAAYCDAWERWLEARRKLEEGGNKLVIKNPKGYMVANPYLGISNRALADLVKYGAELGLNPVQRTRVKIDKPQPSSRRKMLLES